MSSRLMCHVVAGYPSRAECLELMRGMHLADVAAIEVQIPFSDPIADGEAIMQANDKALESGMTTKASFELIGQARQQGVSCPIYVMSYLQKLQHFGTENFCRQVKACQVKGLIIPDMPYESPEYSLLQECVRQYGVKIIPVLSPGMPDERLHALLSYAPNQVYVTSRRGITGIDFTATRELETLVRHIKSQSQASIMVGFGISKPQDVAEALQLGDIAVVGSAVIKEIQSAGVEQALEYVRTLSRSIQ